jgi:hypothetical protein
MANKNGWGGKREGAGRPSGGELIKVRELLDEHIKAGDVTAKLGELIDSGDYRAIDLYLKYRVGVPKQEYVIETTGEMDINFNIKNLVSFKDDNEDE